MFTHLVRNRPAMYPPTEQAINCISTSQMIAVQPTVAPDAPVFAQGETSDMPTPVPKARSARDKAADTKAPATTAPQETPEVLESFPTIDSADSAYGIRIHPPAASIF